MEVLVDDEYENAVVGKKRTAAQANISVDHFVEA